MHPISGKATGLTGYVDAVWTDGALAVDPPPAMHIEFPVERLRTGNDLEDRKMWQLIDSKRFPAIAADLKGAQPGASPGQYAVNGQITFAGRQRKYDGELNVTGDGSRLTVTGSLVLDIRDFGIQPPQMLMFKVFPEVTLRLQLVALKGS